MSNECSRSAPIEDDGFEPPLDFEEVQRIIADLGCDFSFVIRVEAAGSWIREWDSRSEAGASVTAVGGITPETFFELISQEDLTGVRSHFRRAAELGTDCFEYSVDTRDGDPCWVESTLRSVALSEESGAHRIFGVIRDVTRRRVTEEALARSETEFRALIEQASDAILVLDAEGLIEIANPAAIECYGLKSDAFQSEHISSLFDADEGSGLSLSKEALATNGDSRFVRRARSEDGSGAWMDVSVRRLLDQRIQVVARDISERFEAARRVRNLAYFDSLTGLANRARFGEMLRAELERCARSNLRFALLFLDIDRFKQVNDSLGHSAGDELLKGIGDRLRGLLRATDTVGLASITDSDGDSENSPISRIGGDEFTILVSGLEHSQDAARVARRTIHALSRPFRLAGQEVFIGASVGISVWPDDGETAELLMRSADTAMYHAKNQGGQTYAFFNEDMSVQSSRRLQVESKLRRAQARDEFHLVYQPIRNVRTGEIDAVETLLRWVDSDGEFISPAEFIPIAEETGLIVEIGAWVLKTACLQASEWRRQGFAPIRLSVNLSVCQLRDLGVVESIEQILFETGLPPESLELEITETAILDANPRITESVIALTEGGIGFALDDFGTGYSSLSALQRFPIERLKIDRSFISGVGANPNDEALASAIVALAKRLDLKVVAEGVEEEGQARFLSALGCDELQGYLISRPVPAQELTKWLQCADKSEA